MPFAFNLIMRFAQACGVNKHHRQPADVCRLLNRIARRAGDVRDDGAVAVSNWLSKLDFPALGRPHNRRANAAPEKLRPSLAVFNSSSMKAMPRSMRLRNQFSASVRSNVFVGKIYVRFHVGERVHQIITETG